MKDSHQYKACLKNWYQGEYCLKVSIKLYFWCINSYCSLYRKFIVEKSHRSPSDLETRIAHRPKDTVTLGFVGHNSNLTGCERLAPQSKNLFSDCELKRTKNWFNEIGIFSEFQRCKAWFPYRRVCRTKKIHRTDRIHSISYNKLYLSFLLY